MEQNKYREKLVESLGKETCSGTIPYTTGQLLRLTDNEIGQLYDNNVNTTRDCGG